MYKRSEKDLTAAATIREAAMRLFAERGVTGVTVRDIAAEAGVSAGLVIHHYGSKAGLKAAVDERVSRTLVELIGDLADPAKPAGETASMAGLFAERLDAQPLLPAYLRRMLVDGGEQAEQLFRQLYDFAAATMAEYEAAGAVRPSEDPVARHLFLLVNDLAVIVLREQIAAVLGADPLGPQGVTRWTAQVMDVYGRGVFGEGGDPRR